MAPTSASDTGANAIDVGKDVEKTVAALAQRFPQGLTYSIPYDTTRFVEVSIREVVKTLAEAMVLVVLVVFLFLQNWRATLIPVVAVPVSLIGTFAGLLLLGYSINTLTLFGMVLAIGIVVDDAIVVVENVERNIALGLSPIKATEQAMREVTGPIIATALVLWVGVGPHASGRFVPFDLRKELLDEMITVELLAEEATASLFVASAVVLMPSKLAF